MGLFRYPRKISIGNGKAYRSEAYIDPRFARVYLLFALLHWVLLEITSNRMENNMKLNSRSDEMCSFYLMELELFVRPKGLPLVFTSVSLSKYDRSCVSKVSRYDDLKKVWLKYV